MYLRTAVLASIFFGCATSAAQVVQLPTYQVFTLGTTVVVPDGGTALLGGSSYYRSGTNSSGVPGLGKVPGLSPAFGSRAYGAEAGYSRSRVSVEIIDLDEMDRAVLAEAARRRQLGGRSVGGLPQFGEVRSNAGTSSVDPAIIRQAEFLSRHMSRANDSAR